jgi:hypothetical protein
MRFNPLTVLELGGLCSLLVVVVGFGSLFLGTYKARRAFRQKGFLRPPSGSEWFRFLLLRQYEWFESTTIRLCFGTSHVCLIIGFFVIAALALFFGSEFFFNNAQSSSFGVPSAPPLPTQ